MGNSVPDPTNAKKRRLDGREDFMSRDTILKIKETEAEAMKIVAEAEERAKQMRQTAEADGRALCKRTEEELSAELEGMLEQIRIKVEEMSERIMEETREEAAEVAAAARLNRKSAEKIVVRGLDAKCR